MISRILQTSSRYNHIVPHKKVKLFELSHIMTDALNINNNKLGNISSLFLFYSINVLYPLNRSKHLIIL